MRRLYIKSQRCYAVNKDWRPGRRTQDKRKMTHMSFFVSWTKILLWLNDSSLMVQQHFLVCPPRLDWQLLAWATEENDCRDSAQIGKSVQLRERAVCNDNWRKVMDNLHCKVHLCIHSLLPSFTAYCMQIWTPTVRIVFFLWLYTHRNWELLS